MLPTSNRTITITASIVFCIGVSLTAYRTIRQYQNPGRFNDAAQGMCDFHNGIYFPTTALLNGMSPYGEEYSEKYPVARQIPFFSPGILALHAPLAMLPLRVAESLYFLICVALMIAIGAICSAAVGRRGNWSWIMSIAAVLVFSRGGHITLFNGYFTLELILATFAAIHFAKDRPVLAAIALAIVSAKPTYILPLGFLLLARGNIRALVIGAAISIIAAALPMFWLAYHEGQAISGHRDLSAGVSKLLADIQETQEVHMNMVDETPEYSWTRLDLLAIVYKWKGTEPSQAVHLIVMAAMLFVPMLILFRRMRNGMDDGLAGGTGTLILVALLSSLYHQSYDAMLVFAPLAGWIAFRGPFWIEMQKATRVSLALCLLVPTFNYMTTQTVLQRLDWGDAMTRVMTSLNGIALATALVILCIQMWGDGSDSGRATVSCKSCK